MDKQFLINFIAKSEYIKSKTSFKEQLGMIKWVKSLSEQDLKIVLNEVEIDAEVPTPDGPAKKVLSIGFVTAAVILPGGMALHAASQYLLKDFNYKCELKCQNDKTIKNKALCSRHCKTAALKNIVEKLEKEYKGCDASKDPSKCRKRLLPLIKEYTNKRNKAILQLSYATKKARMRGDI